MIKSRLNSKAVLISKALIDSVINLDEFVLINNVLKEYNKMNEEIKMLFAHVARIAKVSDCKVFDRTQEFIKDFTLFIKPCYDVVWSVKKSTESKNPRAARTKNSRIMLLSKCEVCDNKNLKLIKPLEVSRLLSSLRTNTFQ